MAGTPRSAGGRFRAGGGAATRAGWHPPGTPPPPAPRSGMTPRGTPSYAGHRFPPEVIGHAVWLYFRFPLSLRVVEEMLAARGITISHETVRQWPRKFGQAFANQVCRRLPDRPTQE